MHVLTFLEGCIHCVTKNVLFMYAFFYSATLQNSCWVSRLVDFLLPPGVCHIIYHDLPIQLLMTLRYSARGLLKNRAVRRFIYKPLCKSALPERVSLLSHWAKQEKIRSSCCLINIYKSFCSLLSSPHFIPIYLQSQMWHAFLREMTEGNPCQIPARFSPCCPLRVVSIRA